MAGFIKLKNFITNSGKLFLFIYLFLLIVLFSKYLFIVIFLDYFFRLFFYFNVTFFILGMINSLLKDYSSNFKLNFLVLSFFFIFLVSLFLGF
jgi:hypothetical protein